MVKSRRKPDGRPKGEGYVYRDERGYWYARRDYTDSTGKRRVAKRVARSKTGAQDLLRQLVREAADFGMKSLEASQATFEDLAAFYEKNYMIEPKYVDGRKVAGLRSRHNLVHQLKALRAFFTNSKLRSMSYGKIEQYKLTRLDEKTIHKKQRSLAPVNRELALLRRMLNIALREGWILKNPFAAGEPLINLADEKKRERILTREEEKRLFAVCDEDTRRAHLRPILVCALDTGMRKGEIFKLVWRDVDFDNGMINVRAFNTKTMRERQVAMTERLRRELLDLHYKSVPDLDDLVFGIIDTVKTSYGTVRRDAKLEDVRFHDLRHTHATRLVAANVPLPEVGRALGHTQPNTTYRYVNANADSARRAASAIDAFNREPKKKKSRAAPVKPEAKDAKSTVVKPARESSAKKPRGSRAASTAKRGS